MKYYTLFLVLVSLLFACKPKKDPSVYSSNHQYPNIVFILADDLGYGDLACYNVGSKIPTPNIDNLASQGMRFMDAHAPAAVCTPSRYGLLTGQYCWRSDLPQGVLQGYGQAIIKPETLTLPELLKKRGYQTAVVGKWHLGLDWQLNASREIVLKDKKTKVNENGVISNMDDQFIDFGKHPSNGPTRHGFDYSYILPASLDMPPYCYLENDHLTELISEHTAGNDLNTNYTEAFWRPGKIAQDFKFEEVLPRFTSKAVEYINGRSDRQTPFFLYVPLPAPHTPWVPTANFQGKSTAGTYGDFVTMVDASVGMILSALKSNELEENTLVIVTSDNGPYWRPRDIRRFGHRAAHHLRGMKADAWEGGHRIPFIARWPVRIRPKATCNEPISLTDFYTTCADLLNIKLQAGEGEDSQSLLALLIEDNTLAKERKHIIQQSSAGYFAIRKGNWKFIEGLGSGGFSPPQKIQPENELTGQLYNLREDIGEKNNLYQQYPEIVKELRALLEASVAPPNPQ